VTAITCSGDADSGSVVDAKVRAVTIDLDSGEAITCTFSERATRGEYRRDGRLVAGPVVVPFDGDLGAFGVERPGRSRLA
jgi:hypothetical protein